MGRIDVMVSNAGYGLFGAAEELTNKQVEHIVATNLVGPLQGTLSTLRKRIADFEAQVELAASTDFPPGE